ncbi:MAG: hypothetical protein JXD23_05980 [Spirochaetales bacterium]|nr:hypothetical protein [Spirochaetales bacterium]
MRKKPIIAAIALFAFALLFSCEPPATPGVGADLIGSWLGDDVTVGGGGTGDIIVTFGADYTYSAMIYTDYTDVLTLQDGSNEGTYAANPTTLMIALGRQLNGGIWIDIPPGTLGSVMAVGYMIAGNTLTLSGNFDNDPLTPDDVIGPLVRQ